MIFDLARLASKKDKCVSYFEQRTCLFRDLAMVLQVTSKGFLQHLRISAFHAIKCTSTNHKFIRSIYLSHASVARDEFSASF